MLAANYLGITYCPVDLTQPKERIEQIILSAAPALILGDKNFTLSDINSPIFDVTTLTPCNKIVPEPYQHNYSAYLLYTSGSTGQPKGVVIDNRARDNFLCSCTDRVNLDSQSRIVAITSPSFDISILELQGALYVGGQCIIASENTKRSGYKLSSLINQHRVTHLQATPTTWQLLLQTEWQPTTPVTALVGGEALPATLVTALQPLCQQVINMYGPTEATVWVMANQAKGEQSVEPIGNLLANCEAYVVDNHLRYLPANAPGELALAGRCLAEKYDNDPTLTEQRFCYNDEGKRLYLTGDRVILNKNGTFDFLGRTDSQIKRRGFRIELGEIESVCAQIPGINHAAAFYQALDNIQDKQLVLLYQGDVNTDQLYQTLTRKLPNHMYPDLLLPCKEWILNSSGKTNRKALLENTRFTAASRWGESHTANNTADSPHVSFLNQQVVELISASWEKILKRNVSRQSNFLECGGNSLLATLLLQNLRKDFGHALPDTFVFTHPTITAQALYIQPAMNTATHPEKKRAINKKNRFLERRNKKVEA